MRKGRNKKVIIEELRLKNLELYKLREIELAEKPEQTEEGAEAGAGSILIPADEADES